MMKIRWILLLFLPILAEGQVDSVSVKQSDIFRTVDGIGYSLTSPARWKGKEWITFGSVAAGTVAMTLLDEPVRNIFHHQRTVALDRVERMANHYGKPYSAVAITSGFYLTGILFKNEWAKETGLMLASGLTTSTIVQTFFKNAVGRARPNTELGNYSIEPFSSQTRFHSLPSGHTTVAFTVSLILAKQVKSVPLKIVFYSMATATAASRLYLDVHWISDVAMGGAIAWFCADAAVKRIEANRFRYVARKHKVIAWKIYPYPGGLSLRASL